MANNDDIINFKVDTSEISKALLDFREVYSGNLQELFREEFVLLIKELIKLTPPKKRGDSVKKIDQDLRTLFRASQKMEFREEFLNKLKRKGGKNLADVLTKIDSTNRKFINEQPSEARHNRNRDRRGRVVRNPRYQVITTAGDFNKFKKQKVANIGKAKGGWIPKNGIRGTHVKAPAWLKKNATGIYRDTTTDGELSLSITNVVSYINKLNISFSIVKRATKNRRTKMMIKMKRETNRLLRQKKLQ